MIVCQQRSAGDLDVMFGLKKGQRLKRVWRGRSSVVRWKTKRRPFPNSKRFRWRGTDGRLNIFKSNRGRWVEGIHKRIKTEWSRFRAPPSRSAFLLAGRRTWGSSLTTPCPSQESFESCPGSSWCGELWVWQRGSGTSTPSSASPEPRESEDDKTPSWTSLSEHPLTF